jgi:serine/threonine protein kinase
MSSPLSEGRKIGRYEIRSQIGVGGMGEVYVADDTLVRRCLEKKPERRFQSAGDLAFALEAFSQRAITSGPATAALPAPARRIINRELLAWALAGGTALAAGEPKTLFRINSGVWQDYDVTADGQRFLSNNAAASANSLPITVVLNWTADLKR